MDDTERIVTCPRCCEPYIERLNLHTYRCLYCRRTFNVQSLGRGEWIDADTMLRRTEIRQGPVLELYADARPLTFDGGAELAWKLGVPYEHRSDGRTMLWVTEECRCCC